MAYQKCKNGHVYDDSIHALCPYCPSLEREALAADHAAGANLPDTEETLAAGNEVFPLDSEPTLPGELAEDKEERTLYMDPGEKDAKRVSKSKRKLGAWLVTYSHDENGDGYPLFFGKNEIGRNKINDISITDDTMSGHHATILLRGPEVILNDNLSTSGTYVNDMSKTVDKIFLKDNDVIKMGKTLFKIKVIGMIG